jgi:hypothetical protein
MRFDGGVEDGVVALEGFGRDGHVGDMWQISWKSRFVTEQEARIKD